jgi:hypothetical protein
MAHIDAGKVRLPLLHALILAASAASKPLNTAHIAFIRHCSFACAMAEQVSGIRCRHPKGLAALFELYSLSSIC